MTNNEKYQLLNESLKALSERAINLLILKGSAGTGKTYNVLKYMKENNLNYKYINNYTTPLSFYKIIYENRKRSIIIFDDTQSINDVRIKSMLKSICGELDDGRRVVSYYSTSPILEKNNLPESFEIPGASIILIFNDDISGFEPIINRGVAIDFSFGFEEMIEILKDIQKSAKIEQEVMDYVRENCNQATLNLSIRALVILSSLHRAGFDFKLFAREILKIDKGIYDLINLSEKDWCDKTGQHRATYYRKRKSLKVA